MFSDCLPILNLCFCQQPVRFVDMPGVAAPDVKWMLEGAAQRLKERYPAMFSTSERCKVPNVHLDVLREELFAAEVVARFGIASEDQFVAWLTPKTQSWRLARRRSGSRRGPSAAEAARAVRRRT